MALLQNIGTEYGVYASYWKITEFKINLDGSCDLSLSGFHDEHARLASMKPLKMMEFSVTPQIVQEYFPQGIDLELVYEYLKTLGEFTNSTSV